jgi:hypothetical protein
MFSRNANILDKYENTKSEIPDNDKIYERFKYIQRILFPSISEVTLKVN